MLEFYSYSRADKSTYDIVSQDIALDEYSRVHDFRISERFKDCRLDNDCSGFNKMLNKIRERDKDTRPSIIMKEFTTLSRSIDSRKTNLDRILDLEVDILFIDHPMIDARSEKGYSEFQRLIDKSLEEISTPCCLDSKSMKASGSNIPYGKRIDREISSPLDNKIYIEDNPEEKSIIGIIGMQFLGYTNTKIEEAFKIHEYLFYHKHSDKSIYDPSVTGKIIKRGNSFMVRALNHFGFFNRGKKWTLAAVKDLIESNVSLREIYWRAYIDSNLIKK